MSTQLFDTSASDLLRRFSDHSIISRGQWQLITQGTSNQIMRCEQEQGTYILRINAQADQLFGVDRKREALLLSLISNQPWAVNVIENSVTQGFCLMQEHAASDPLTQQQLVDFVAQLQSFSMRLSEQHKQALFFDYSALLSCYKDFFQQANSMLANRANLIISDVSIEQHLQVTNETAMSLCELILRAFTQLPSIGRCLVHQDLHPLNICQESTVLGQQLKVIDWEYGGWGNPWLDITALYSQFSVDLTKLSSLPLTRHLTEQELTRGINISGVITDALENIWYWYRHVKNHQANVHSSNADSCNKVLFSQQVDRETVADNVANSQRLLAEFI